jgi:hypothetical protein
MKTLILTAAITLLSLPVMADTCEELAFRASQGDTSNMSGALARKYAINAYQAQCGGGGQQQQSQRQEVQQQFVPSIGKTCTIVNGQVTECWN